MTVHADYTQPCYTIIPKFKHPKIKKVFGITQYICDTLKNNFGVDAELCYNPLAIEQPQKRLTLVSATRLSAIKGGKRMKALAEALDLAGINYVWYVFTNDNDCINSNNVIFLQPLNMPSETYCNPLGSTTGSDKSVHSLNAAAPIFKTLFGMSIFKRLLQL